MEGAPGWFGAWIVFVVVVGIGIKVWRVSTARDLAKRAGLDPDDAAAVTLMSHDGLGATYLAANLAGTHTAAQQPADAGHIVADLSGEAAARTTPSEGQAHPVADRLRELEQLRSQQLISDIEYDARRKAILESI